jgi:hypothetical protein
MKTLALVLPVLGLLLSSPAGARANQVTFQVNMSAQTSLGNFDPASDTVVVAGDAINSWSTTASPLASSTTDTNIWVGTFNVPGNPGSTVQYKFVTRTGSGLVWEGHVGAGGAAGNRTTTLANYAQILPAVYFNNVTNSSTVTNRITFQVNLGVQIALGNFDPGSGTFTVAGDFNKWNATANPLTSSASDTNIWETTISLTGAVGSAVSFKYVMNGTYEGNVGPGGAQNRTLNLERTNQILPVVYFNNVNGAPVPTPLIFQVNLGVQTALGNFNPATDMVEARGTFNNWSAGFSLTNGPDNPNVYSGTWVDNSDLPGNVVQYQFVLNSTTWETSVGDRNYTLTSTNEQTLPLVFFNDVNNLGPVTIEKSAGGQATLSWNAGPLISLSGASLLTGPWATVSNTLGANSVTVPIGPGIQFFRLTGP